MKPISTSLLCISLLFSIGAHAQDAATEDASSPFVEEHATDDDTALNDEASLEEGDGVLSEKMEKEGMFAEGGTEASVADEFDDNETATQESPVETIASESTDASISDQEEPQELALEESEKPQEVPSIQEAPASIAFNDEIQPLASAMVVTKEKRGKGPIEINLQQVFAGSPVIYSILLILSISAVCIWLYSLLSLRSAGKIPTTLQAAVRSKLNSNSFEDAIVLCVQNENVFCKMLSAGIQSRGHGLPIMLEAMKAEGKRASVQFWQRLGLLNDIALIAPMLGLLGTVLGMFYAFYDINRSIESVSTLFDGLGISVGTTVAGLIVSILAMTLHSLAKFRLVKVLAHVENEAQSLATVIDDRTSLYNKS